MDNQLRQWKSIPADFLKDLAGRAVEQQRCLAANHKVAVSLIRKRHTPSIPSTLESIANLVNKMTFHDISNQHKFHIRCYFRDGSIMPLRIIFWQNRKTRNVGTLATTSAAIAPEGVESDWYWKTQTIIVQSCMS